jgi:hypothetical protein
MTSFYLFAPAKSAIENNSLNLSTGNYYAVLVQTLPDVNTTTVAGLSLCAGAGYTAVPLSGLVYNPNSKWTFDDFRFSKAQFTTPVMGVVICKRLGTIPVPTDILIVFSSLINSLNYPYILKPGNFAVDVDIPPSGLIQFETFTGYSSGVWNGVQPLNNGIFNLIGTKNNTVAYSNPTDINPVNNQVRVCKIETNGILTNIDSVADKSNNAVGIFPSGVANFPQYSLLFDFWGINGASKKYIKVGDIGFNTFQNSLLISTFFCSNDPSVYNNPLSTALWTQVGVGNFSIFTGSSGLVLTRPTIDYFRFLRFNFIVNNNFNSLFGISNIDFYDSTILSNTLNFS